MQNRSRIKKGLFTGLSIFLLLSGMPSEGFGQDKYLDSMYNDISRYTEVYFNKAEEALKMDIFVPEGNKNTERPLLLYVHGGGFSGGSRDESRHLQFCKTMAKKGYVTATMSYSLVMKGQSFGCDQPSPNKISTFLSVGRDISRATAFLIRHKEKFQINTGRIILAGSSAGAEGVLHAAYWPKTYADDSTQILQENFKYAGVISMAGALTDLAMVNENSAIPTQFFHGTCDRLVPYGRAPHHYCSVEDPGYLQLYGPKAIADKLAGLGKGYFMVTECYGGHEWASKPLKENIPEITGFIYHDILNKETRQIHKILAGDQKPCTELNHYSICED